MNQRNKISPVSLKVKMMYSEDALFDLVSEFVIVCREKEAEGIENRLIDMLEAYTIAIDPLQDSVDKLIGDMVLVGEDEVRGVMFRSIERMRLYSHAVEVVLSPLIDMFAWESSAFIANTLMLFPLASDPKSKLIKVAQRYSDHEENFVRKNALQALQYLTKTKG